MRALLDRDGVILGCSAGSIILGSFIVRGVPNSGLLMVEGHERGFAFLKNVAIDPHLTQAKRESELLDVVRAHPNLLGIGIDEDAGLVVHGNCFEVSGSGRVAIYDHQAHAGAGYYWLRAGENFDLSTWQKSSCLAQVLAPASWDRHVDYNAREARFDVLAGFCKIAEVAAAISSV